MSRRRAAQIYDTCVCVCARARNFVEPFVERRHASGEDKVYRSAPTARFESSSAPFAHTTSRQLLETPFAIFFFFFSLGLGTLGPHDVRPLSGRPPAAPRRRRSGRHGRSSDRVSQASYKSPVLPGSGTFRIIVVVGCPMSRVKPLVRAFRALCQAEGGCRRYTCGDIRRETAHVRAGG